MKKILCFIFALCLILPCSIFLSACKNEEKKQEEQEKTSIVITYASRYGDLEFTSKELQLNNGYVDLNEEDFPKITNEGNDKIFDYWATSSGGKFSSDIKLTHDIELQAVFDYDVEFVWEEDWNLYDSLDVYKNNRSQEISFSYDNGDFTEGAGSFVSSYDGHDYIPTFKKIKKSNCLEKYITEEEYEALSNKSCFVTSVDKKTIVTTDDLTTDTYNCKYYIFIDDTIEGVSETSTYLPKGVNLERYDLYKEIAYRYAEDIVKQEVGFDYQNLNVVFNPYGDDFKGHAWFTDEEIETLTQDTFNEKCEDGNIEGKDWQADSYKIIIKYSWIKFSVTLNDGTTKYFALTTFGEGYTTRLFKDITKEQYDSYTIE